MKNFRMHLLSGWIHYFYTPPTKNSTRVPSSPCYHVLAQQTYANWHYHGVFAPQFSEKNQSFVVAILWTLNKQKSAQLSSLNRTNLFLNKLFPCHHSLPFSPPQPTSTAAARLSLREMRRRRTTSCIYTHVIGQDGAAGWLQSSVLLTARSQSDNCSRLLLLWPPL